MNDIFSHFISRDTKDDLIRVGYMLWFDESFPMSEFSGDDVIMKHFCYYCGRLSVPMKLDYLKVFMSTELKRILIETDVRVPGTDTVSYEDPVGIATAYSITREYMENEFRILASYDSDVNDFKVAASEFISSKLTSRTIDELGKSYDLLSASEDAEKTVARALDVFTLLKDIYDPEILEELDGVGTVNKPFEFVTDTGIKVIDEDISGLYTTQMVGLEAQPGVGKTRFALGVIAYRAAVVYKKNVIYYQLEQTKFEAEAMLIARHVFTLFNIQISSGMIQFGKVPPELKSKVDAAKIDLFHSGKYGKIYINRTDLYYETLRPTFRKDDKMHGPFDVVIIDYMGLIMQKTEKYQKALLDYEVIGNSYRRVKNYVMNTNKLAIVIGQFNEKGIEAGMGDKEITTNMVQGGIAAYRHSDQNLALSRTSVMKAQQKLRISQPKIRGTAGFGRTVIDTRLGFCYFYQNKVQEI